MCSGVLPGLVEKFAAMPYRERRGKSSGSWLLLNFSCEYDFKILLPVNSHLK